MKHVFVVSTHSYRLNKLHTVMHSALCHGLHSRTGSSSSLCISLIKRTTLKYLAEGKQTEIVLQIRGQILLASIALILWAGPSGVLELWESTGCGNLCFCSISSQMCTKTFQPKVIGLKRIYWEDIIQFLYLPTCCENTCFALQQSIMEKTVWW